MLSTQSLEADPHRPKPRVVLLGDGTVWNLISGWGWGGNYHVWPSQILLPDSDGAALEKKGVLPPPLRRNGVYNAAVVGDTTMNVINRLQGSQDERMLQSPDVPFKLPLLQSLLKELQPQSLIKLWVIHVGANDLSPDRIFDPCPLFVLLELIFRNMARDSKILLTGLFYRAHVPNEYMDKVNEQYRRAVKYFAKRYGAERIQFLPAPGEIDRIFHMGQGLHLDGYRHEQPNLEGYRIWMRHLVPKMWQMLEEPQNVGGSQS